MVELSCHGGQLAPARLLAALHAAGARQAAPGEFTRRAVLNGKLDLVQAEAVGDLIDAAAPAQARAALRQLEGGLSRRLAELRESLVEVQALLSYEIDFPGEDDGPVPPERIAAALEDVAGPDRRGCSRRLRPPTGCARGPCWCWRAGRTPASRRSSTRCSAPAGRSSPRSRARRATRSRRTPTSSAGRCGWRTPPASRIRRDRLERMGIEVSRRYLAAADLVLLCVEAGRELGADEAALAA